MWAAHPEVQLPARLDILGLMVKRMVEPEVHGSTIKTGP
jgi:hypothetical protein